MADSRISLLTRLGTLTKPQLACLWAVLVAGLLLRAAGLAWGLPPATPETQASGIRSSYAFDEDNILESLSRTNPAKFDIDPKLYHWGTLHLELVLFALESAQFVGAFENPWRDAYRDMIPGDFERIYIVGRLLSVMMDLATVFVTFLLGLEIAGPVPGLWAAALVAVSAGHLLQASQIRVDVTAACLTVLVVLVTLRMLSSAKLANWFLLGLVAGLAVSAKYSSLLMVSGSAGVAVWQWRSDRRMIGFMVAGAATGFLIGEPFLLTNTNAVVRQIGRLIWLSRQIPEDLLISKPALLAQHLADLARFSLGIPALALSSWGLWILAKRRSPARVLIPVVVLAGIVSLIPQNWPLMRYHLALIPFFAVGAAVAIFQLPSPWRWATGIATLLVALAASMAQVHYMRSPHPINLALGLLQKVVPAGETVARIMPEAPPLDASVYPAGPNPLLDDLTNDPPCWVIISSLPLIAYPETNMSLLQSRYERVAVFQSERLFNWATLGESGAPHDWKYTHPTMTVYRLR